ncbi:hypothetical protein ACFO26_09405 [Lactococcus nasutitermitis]|uniref:Uncharacterized protein n=1 Tax=Lactococcus nasutitermitis TaxID=1652957 RepID=A0ABV9JIF5_9LACT|nr:hypothetical protein [Lactococcus nasutitermitis]
MGLFERFKQEKEKESPQETFERLMTFMKSNQVWHGLRVDKNGQTGEIGLFVFTSQEEMQRNKNWWDEGRALTQSSFQELAENFCANSLKERELWSILFMRFVA